MTYTCNQQTTKMPAKKKKPTKRQVTHMTYNVSGVEDYMMYAATDVTQSVIFDLSVEAIRHSLSENTSSTDICYLRGPIGQDNIHISIGREDFKPILKRAIKFYSRLNKYERCIDCQCLINAIQ